MSGCSGLFWPNCSFGLETTPFRDTIIFVWSVCLHQWWHSRGVSLGEPSDTHWPHSRLMRTEPSLRRLRLKLASVTELPRLGTTIFSRNSKGHGWGELSVNTLTNITTNNTAFIIILLKIRVVAVNYIPTKNMSANNIYFER